MAAIPYDMLTGYQKSAVLLIALGEDLSSNVLEHLDDDEVGEISKEIVLMRDIERDTVDQVLDEFHHMALAKGYLTKGGLEYAKSILNKSLGPEKARKIIDRLTRALEQSSGFSFLQKVHAPQLAKFIQNEHPQTISLIMAHLDPSQAAECLAALPEDLQPEVAIRMANLDEISPEVVKKISAVLEEKLDAFTSYQVEIGGVRSVAELFNRMDRTAGKATLEKLEKLAPELAAQIRDMMFVFDDIRMLGDTAITEILKRVDKKVLTIALKGTDEDIQGKFFSNMSRRASDTLREEMEFLGPLKVRDVEKAQQEVIEIVRALEEEGIITIGEQEELIQ
ncbi:flagellar motor switch protein FliG [Desulfurispira natronophila]|uniref:Flagellar motor switch protein FliG n=1 Tax=Desulfurispira natronophila TaxID=682562 RepID=A0A7W7Y621_9BACT|nr:flagellar motor switch protein FliG [Desulfurispira natronophila]MBB5022392.1 flagellar motor switch protein FliG [Desulfurispira natronophila]